MYSFSKNSKNLSYNSLNTITLIEDRILKSVLKKAEDQYYRGMFDTKYNSIKKLWFNLNLSFSLSVIQNQNYY